MNQQQSKIDPIRLYRAPEVAELLHVTSYRVRQMVRSGELPAKNTRKWGQMRISGQAILDFVGVTNNG